MTGKETIEDICARIGIEESRVRSVWSDIAQELSAREENKFIATCKALGKARTLLTDILTHLRPQ